VTLHSELDDESTLYLAVIVAVEYGIIIAAAVGGIVIGG
jgi:hypothetical protein